MFHEFVQHGQWPRSKQSITSFEVNIMFKQNKKSHFFIFILITEYIRNESYFDPHLQFASHREIKFRTTSISSHRLLTHATLYTFRLISFKYVFVANFVSWLSCEKKINQKICHPTSTVPICSHTADIATRTPFSILNPKTEINLRWPVKTLPATCFHLPKSVNDRFTQIRFSDF